MRWHLPGGALAIVLLLLVFLPLWEGMSADMVTYKPPPPPDAPPPPPPPPPPNVVPTVTAIAAMPEEARKTERFLVEGTVRELHTGAPAPGVVVALFLNETKDRPGVRVGTATTDASGQWRIEPDLRGMDARDYQVVAMALASPINATHAYGASDSDPPLRVLAGTRLLLDVPSKHSQGQPLWVAGALRDEAGEGVQGAAVWLEVQGQAPVQASTDAQGVFRHEAPALAPGAYAVRARFDGRGNLDPAQAEARVEVVDLELVVPRRIEAVRGEAFDLQGEVRLGPVGQPGRAVRVQYLFPLAAGPGEGGAGGGAGGGTEGGAEVPGLERTLHTDGAGRFADRQRVAPHAPLSDAMARVHLDERGLVAPVQVSLRARTTLQVEAPADALAAVPLAVLLVDDLGLPVAGAPVALEALAGGQVVARSALTTDAAGRASGQLDPGLRMGEVQVRARFGGQGFHLASEGHASLQAHGLLLAAAAAGGATLALALALRRVQQRREAPSPRAELRLGFPGLGPGVPAVWAPGEEVHVEVELRDPQGQPAPHATLRLRAGDEGAEVLTDAHGRAAWAFRPATEGDVPLVAEAPAGPGRPAGWAAAVVRVGDYRVEAAREFRDLRHRLGRMGLALPAHLAPRELEEALRAAGEPPPELEPLLQGMEVANYSPRPFGRDDFLAFVEHKRRFLDALGGGEAPA